MDDIKEKIVSANKVYQTNYSKGHELLAQPRLRLAILTCQDARFDPNKAMGLVEGDAHVLRNYGGRASEDAIRSLALSHKFFGTAIWFVVHMTDSPVPKFDNSDAANLLNKSLAPARFKRGAWANPLGNGGTPEALFTNWLCPFEPESTLLNDIRRMRHHALVDPEITISGFLFDAATGKLTEVESAVELGAPLSL